MASIPSLAVSGGAVATAFRAVLAADAHKPPPGSVGFDKGNSYQGSTQVLENGRLEAPPRPLDAQEAMAMLKEGQSVQSAMYVPLLHRCIETGSLGGAKALHGHMVKTGTIVDIFVATSLVNVYMRCGNSQDARNLFDEMPEKNVVTWTALITGYTLNSQPVLALEVFVEMLKLGRYPSDYTLGGMLSACVASHNIDLGKQVHGYTIKYGAASITSIGNSLCRLYTKSGNLESGIRAFKRIPDKNVITWTTMISACAEDENYTELGLNLFLDMLKGEVMPNEFTLTSVMSLCGTSLDMNLGKQVQGFCFKIGCATNLPVKNSTMYLYLRKGETEEAMRLFEEMEDNSVITWNAMISGFAQIMDSAKDDLHARSRGFQALKIFRDLVRSAMKPDLFTFSSILSVCSTMMALEQGEQIHAQTIKTGFLSDVVVNSALVNMYNKCGCIEYATKAFVEMPTRTLVTWTSMISGYSQHGRPHDAIQLFEDMILAGAKPNEITFVSLLSACSYAGLVEEAMRYFDMMQNEYHIEPLMDHYGCMIDMFVRLGRLDDAYAFIKRKGFEPNEAIWSSLVAGCRSHGNMELAFYAADRLLELKPKVVETYVLLLNMYISTGRWRDVARVRKLSKHEDLGILRDRSWITIRDKVYFFKADDRSHPQSTELYQLLETLLEKAKAIGYEPYQNTELYDSEEDGKPAAGSLKHHSERLAVALGLLKAPPGVTVRITKNITMCRDCHSSIKFFSLLANREIVVRDSKRLHKFKDGRCSCGDFGTLL
ncbi:putative pentatricopeptide repeat-containing protein At5g52630 isoform X1 [Brachypodium distachyon]|uniref:putative pentatricopeptide repeat-containing protein At5g52630 isoform X1 n=2 Tax=Brachypodium distachyon TaxID=15368 RepID=UPI0001C759B7|nr:putative pentatricopeptide repeat-containing protein At5g52630 isoform X1 [Brachypodium distachyon]XP_024312670.1 putative pentatricopeptide repeat-containing protein At5g52630 isoform X1 [Brachypodium distachyon]|eukprot:XP_024312669.1 putative pentatricopeptide repeat-containing protein At5g52630 isoform X1 [Brachypodium distachyon]